MRSKIGEWLAGGGALAAAGLWFVAEIARPFQGFPFEPGQAFAAAFMTFLMGALLRSGFGPRA